MRSKSVDSRGWGGGDLGSRAVLSIAVLCDGPHTLHLNQICHFQESPRSNDDVEPQYLDTIWFQRSAKTYTWRGGKKRAAPQHTGGLGAAM